MGGAQAFVVFDRTFSEEENKQEIEGELNVMVKMIPRLITFLIEGNRAVQMTDFEKEMGASITCTLLEDFMMMFLLSKIPPQI